MTEIPNALVMRALKYGNRPDGEKDRVAEALRAAGRRSEAVLLYDGRPDHPTLEEERRWAVEHGVAFHLFALRRRGMDVPDEDLERCGRAAEAGGHWLEARLCWQALEDEEGLARIAPQLPESLRPAPEAEAGEESG
ncbi:MAG: hypothetical protein ACC662_02865 [Planctomycetota bacterium]